MTDSPGTDSPHAVPRTDWALVRDVLVAAGGGLGTLVRTLAEPRRWVPARLGGR